MGVKGKGQQKSDETTRERILRHAINRFSIQSYETTGLREIASDAGVDVALVHRSFGSKAQLFAECIEACIQTDELLVHPEAGTITHLCQQSLLPRAEGEMRPIDIILRSFSSSEASGIIRDIATANVIEPLAAIAGPGREVNVVMSLAAMFGFTIMRDVIGIELLKKTSPEEISRYFNEINQVLKVS